MKTIKSILLIADLAISVSLLALANQKKENPGIYPLNSKI